MKNELIKYCLLLSSLFILLSITLFNQISFWFLGTGIAVAGIILLYAINHKK